MSRQTPVGGLILTRRKEKNRQKLAERYYGKKALLETWDELFAGKELPYRNDLKRRVNSHKQDLAYRGEEPE